MTLILSMGGILFYVLLYQTELVPRWLSGWGLVGTAVTIVASCLFMFRVVGLTTSVYMTFLLALQEMVLSLIAKGIHSAVPA